MKPSDIRTKPKVIDTDRKIRRCLGNFSPQCPGEFMSSGPEERICPKCKATKAYRDGGANNARWGS